MGRWRQTATVALVGVALVLGGRLVLLPSILGSGGAPAPPAGVLAISGRWAPDFTLTDQFGQIVSLRQFRGKAVVLAFVDSQCTTICPLTSAAMVEAARLLGPATGQVQLLAVNANPIATSVADVQAYSRAHGLLYGWWFVTGTRSALVRVWKSYGIYVALSHGAVVHTAAIYVIGPGGHLRFLLGSTMDEAAVTNQARIIAQLVSATLPDHPALTPALPVVPPITSQESAALPLAQGGTLPIGRSHAHLYLFFATWLSELTNLSTAMANQNDYVSVARQHGWPSLVAVDETVTEPTATALSQFLGRLGRPLLYPVVMDPGGRLAGGLSLIGSPEYMLVVNGKVRWRHQGWLSANQLAGSVATQMDEGVTP